MSKSTSDPLNPHALTKSMRPKKTGQWIVRTATLNDVDTILRFTLDEAIEAEGRVEDSKRVKKAISLAVEDPIL